MRSELKLLLVEDSDSDAELLIKFLKKQNVKFSFKRVWIKSEFERELISFEPDLIIADYHLPQFTGMEAFRITKSLNKQIPFIIITGAISEEILVLFMQEGVSDYILKSSLLRLPGAIENVISKKELEEEKKKIHNLNIELKEINTDIRDSIRYAKRIQEAVMSDFELFKKEFIHSFLISFPKDILSGDFFWFTKADDKIIFCVADCTGHGVPGALLSVLGCTLLNDIVVVDNICHSDKILKRLNAKIQDLLHNEKNKMSDGMDLAICSIDESKRSIEYSGAYNPLYIVRDRKLIVINPNKQGIGGSTKHNTSYIKHIINLQKKDRIFIFSDGFADQFNHLTNKKLTRKIFQEILISSSELEIQKQKKFLSNFLTEWKGSLEQTDDVMLLGIEID